MSIWIRRAYDPPTKNDGKRILVDRLWPRGVSKDELSVDSWMKEIAPSNELRKWYGHDPEKWEEFKVRYRKELDAQPDAVAELVEYAKNGRITLIYAAKDTDINNAVALREYLEEQI
ncbi:MAG: DUF488 domain-containing protein [Candidatus Hydrogenedentes bacterium]|nr:DUF488 domain-containing protein [Candidatus Hydrogenedentota bacterium]